jgi:plasmid stability protein
MATLTIKNIPDTVVRRLKRRAVAHRRSLNLEVIAVLEAATQSVPVDAEEVIARARAVRATPRGVRLTDALLKRWKNEGRP